MLYYCVDWYTHIHPNHIENKNFKKEEKIEEEEEEVDILCEFLSNLFLFVFSSAHNIHYTTHTHIAFFLACLRQFCLFFHNEFYSWWKFRVL